MRKPSFDDDLRFARALCSGCGICAGDYDDAVQEILIRIHSAPRRHRRALALRTARDLLARQLGVSPGELPEAFPRLKQVAGYESARERAEQTDRILPGSAGAFDHHSRRFAEENGVCPRCGGARLHGGDNGHALGCACGWSAW